ncbi:MAG: lysylphosphatidylglycerol synthase domain-containing protein [Pseudomonadota bacterium]
MGRTKTGSRAKNALRICRALDIILPIAVKPIINSVRKHTSLLSIALTVGFYGFAGIWIYGRREYFRFPLELDWACLLIILIIAMILNLIVQPIRFAWLMEKLSVRMSFLQALRDRFVLASVKAVMPLRIGDPLGFYLVTRKWNVDPEEATIVWVTEKFLSFSANCFILLVFLLLTFLSLPLTLLAALSILALYLAWIIVAERKADATRPSGRLPSTAPRKFGTSLVARACMWSRVASAPTAPDGGAAGLHRREREDESREAAHRRGRSRVVVPNFRSAVLRWAGEAIMLKGYSPARKLLLVAGTLMIEALEILALFLLLSQALEEGWAAIAPLRVMAVHFTGMIPTVFSGAGSREAATLLVFSGLGDDRALFLAAFLMTLVIRIFPALPGMLLYLPATRKEKKPG